MTIERAAAWSRWWSALPNDVEPLATARRTGFVLPVSQLFRLGISRSAQRTALRRGRWTAPTRGVVAPLQVDSPSDDGWEIARRRHALLAAAVALRQPDIVVAGRSAAVLSGLPTLRLPTRAETSAPYGSSLGRHGDTHKFGARLPSAHVTSWFGVPVTTIERTVLDLARHDRRDGVMAADAALRERPTSAVALDRELDTVAGWPGARTAREVVAFADGRAESPLESLVRLALHDEGFPPPELQMVIAGYRVDFYWPQLRLIVEADGRTKYSGDELWREKRREHELHAAVGCRIERVLWSDVTASRWPSTVRRLWLATAA